MHDYFLDLWERWRDGEINEIRYEPCSNAQMSKCHENVDAYIRGNPDCKAIRGAWVQPIGGNGGCLFHAHSLVELPGGEWLDITPLRDDPDEDARLRRNLVFLEHRGTDEQFRHFRTIAQVPWPPAVPDTLEPDFSSGEGLM
jgi:hypothetical protein